MDTEVVRVVGHVTPVKGTELVCTSLSLKPTGASGQGMSIFLSHEQSLHLTLPWS